MDQESSDELQITDHKSQPQPQPQPPHQGHGLTSMRARAAELGGQLQIDSAPDQGTRLTLNVPLK
jgi:signal transduction histidine kinase